jgi:tetratricopeptide (TPR) repeat protein
MSPALWRKVKPLFEAALDLPEGERASFVLARLGGEPAAADELLAMLRAHEQSASVLDRSLPERIAAIPHSEVPADGLSAGQLVAGRYRLRRELGRGGNGSVWEASDEAVLGRAVVVKALHAGGLGLRFENELAALARLNHRLIAAPLDSGVLEDGRRYIVLEFIDGPTLREALRGGPLEPMRACRLVSLIAQALDAAQQQGVWHLDLKPDNVLLRGAGSPGEEPVLVDFGISRLTGAAQQTEQPAGSLAYAPEEQLSGAPAATSDQYSLARMAVEMITGHRPAALESPAALMARCAALHPRAMRVFAKALSSHPGTRFVSTSNFAEELTAALDPQVAASRRRRLLAAVFCFLLFAATLVYVWLNRERENLLLRQEADALLSQTNMVVGLLDAGYLDQKLLAERVRIAVQRLTAHVDSGKRERNVLLALFEAQMLYGVMHGHPAIPHLGSIEVGIRSLEDGLRTLELIFEGREKGGRYMARFAIASDALASLLIEAGQYDRSAAVAKRALQSLDDLEKSRKLNQDLTQHRANLLMTLSRAPFHKQQWEECLALRNEGVRLKRQALERQPSAAASADLAGVLAARGYLHRDMGRLEDALRDYEESDAILARLKAEDIRNLKYDWLRAKNQLEEARTLLLLGKPKAAEALLDASVRSHRSLRDELPQGLTIRRTLALSLSWLASARRLLGLPPERWRPLILEAVEHADFGLSRDPQNAKAWDESQGIRSRAAEAGVELPPPPVPPPAAHGAVSRSVVPDSGSRGSL